MFSFKFERYVNFEFYKTIHSCAISSVLFERYVNFEFYKTKSETIDKGVSLRDM